MPAIDLNCDLGESYGAWQMGQDEAVLGFITSANIACGFHAGDANIMRGTVLAAVSHGVAIGAHPSLPDLQGFGRREMQVSADEVHALVLYQIGALSAFARAAGTALAHVKPHGALYNMAARDTGLADAIANAVRAFDVGLILVGLADSELTRAGARAGLRVAHEAFADRRYRSDGSLVPRREAGAVIHDVDAALAQALGIAARGKVQADDGSIIDLRADTICVHGDRPDAALFAERLQRGLIAAGFAVSALSKGPA